MLKRAVLLFLIFNLVTGYCSAQLKDSTLPQKIDSLPVKDSLSIVNTPVNLVTVTDSVKHPLQKILKENIYLKIH